MTRKDGPTGKDLYVREKTDTFEKTAGTFYIDGKEVTPLDFEYALLEAAGIAFEGYMWDSSGVYEFFEEEWTATVAGKTFKHIPVEDAWAKEWAVRDAAEIEYDQLPKEVQKKYELAAVYASTVHDRNNRLDRICRLAKDNPAAPIEDEDKLIDELLS